tara:strand:+ start:330 stop:497 length:168 start_codon:yes stop_codon:yes gene_type:complete
MRTIQFSTIGNSVGIILAHAFLKKMGIQSGDYLTVKETSKGIELSPASSDFTKAM